MQGIEILTSAQVATEWAFNWTAFWFAFGIITIVLFLCSLAYMIDDICAFVIVVGLIMSSIGGGLIGLVVGKIGETPTVYETQYKVTISDETAMSEFLEHYEMIDQDGKIFTVRMKINEEHK